MANETDDRTVHARLIAAVARVDHVKATGRMRDAGNYEYLSETDLLNAVRPALIAEGLVVVPVAWDEITHETYQTKAERGRTMNRVTARGFWDIIAPDGSSIRISAMGDGADVGDKGTNKVQTGALKYALRHTFLVATGDDPDHQSSDEQERETDAERDARIATRTADREAMQEKLNALGELVASDENLTRQHVSQYVDSLGLPTVARWFTDNPSHGPQVLLNSVLVWLESAPLESEGDPKTAATPAAAQAGRPNPPTPQGHDDSREQPPGDPQYH